MRRLGEGGWGTTAGVVLLVAAALVVVIGGGALITMRDREVAAQQAFARVVADRAAAVAQALDEAGPSGTVATLRRFHSEGFRVWLTDREPPPGGPVWRHGEEIEAAAREALPASLRTRAFVRAVPGQPPPFEPGEVPSRPVRERWHGGFYTLVIGLPLEGGRWMIAAAPARPEAFGVGVVALTAIGLLVLATVAAALVVARRMTRPLVMLSEAAGRLANDLDAPPLPVRGSREVRRAATAFNTMQERLRRLVDDRTLMVAAMSHDLRTVITRLRLRAEDIGDDVQREKALQDLHDMEVMLTEALEAARGEAAREERRPTDLAALCRSLVDDLADAGRPATFEGPERLVVACRPVAVRRALANVVENALRYGGSADVRLTLANRLAAIEVADRGPGVPDGLKEQMFRPFMRGEASRSRETGGSGLGLGVARSLMRAHGGDLVLHDRPGGGLVARLTLPVEP